MHLGLGFSLHTTFPYTQPSLKFAVFPSLWKNADIVSVYNLPFCFYYQLTLNYFKQLYFPMLFFEICYLTSATWLFGKRSKITNLISYVNYHWVKGWRLMLYIDWLNSWLICRSISDLNDVALLQLNFDHLHKWCVLVDISLNTDKLTLLSRKTMHQLFFIL